MPRLLEHQEHGEDVELVKRLLGPRKAPVRQVRPRVVEEPTELVRHLHAHARQRQHTLAVPPLCLRHDHVHERALELLREEDELLESQAAPATEIHARVRGAEAQDRPVRRGHGVGSLPRRHRRGPEPLQEVLRRAARVIFEEHPDAAQSRHLKIRRAANGSSISHGFKTPSFCALSSMINKKLPLNLPPVGGVVRQ